MNYAGLATRGFQEQGGAPLVLDGATSGSLGQGREVPSVNRINIPVECAWRR